MIPLDRNDLSGIGSRVANLDESYIPFDSSFVWAQAPHQDGPRWSEGNLGTEEDDDICLFDNLHLIGGKGDSTYIDPPGYSTGCAVDSYICFCFMSLSFLLAFFLYTKIPPISFTCGASGFAGTTIYGRHI